VKETSAGKTTSGDYDRIKGEKKRLLAAGKRKEKANIPVPARQGGGVLLEGPKKKKSWGDTSSQRGGGGVDLIIDLFPDHSKYKGGGYN